MRMMKRRIATAVALGALALTAAACGGDDGGDTGSNGDGPSGEPIVIGVAVPKTGSVAILGQEVEAATKLAVDDINAAGGVDGRPLKVEVVDTTDESGKAIAAIQQLKSKNPVVITGPITGAIVTPLAGIADQIGVPILHGSGSPTFAANGEAGSEWFFRVRVSESVTASAMTEYIVENLPDVKTVAIQHDNFPTGEGFTKEVTELLGKNGIEVVASDPHDVTARDFSPQVARALKADPDMLILQGYPADNTILFRQFKEQGLADDVPIMGNVALINAAFIFDLIEPAELNGLLATVDSWPAASDDADVQSIATRLQEEYGLTATEQTGSFYTAMLMVADAIERAGSDDPAKVADALRDTSDLTSWNGLAAPATFDCAEGTQDCAPTRLMVQVDNAELKIVSEYDARSN